MATQKRIPKTTYVSPKGVFRYPNLIKPDYGTDQFPKKDGEFNVQLILTPAEKAKMEKQLAKEWDRAVDEANKAFKALSPQQQKKLGGSPTLNEVFQEFYASKQDTEPTGDFVVKFATKATGKNDKGEPYTRKIPLFDSMGQPANSVTAIWGGTLGKISFTCSPYFVPGSGAGGLKLYLSAVMISKLVAGGAGAGASAFGFEPDEDGEFDAGEATPEAFPDEASDTPSDASEEASEVEDF